KEAGYKLAYTGFPGPVWTKSHITANKGTVSNAVAYAFTDAFHQTTMAPTDRLIYMTNAKKGTRNFFIADPATGNVLTGPRANGADQGWDRLTLGGAPNIAQVHHSAVTLSTGSTQARSVTTDGYFGAVSFGNAATGAKEA